MIAVIAVAAGIYFLGFNTPTATDEQSIRVQVQQGDFEVYVTATGELQAKRSEKILGPQGMRAARIYQATIADIVPEGTIVKEGDFVARLDRSELDGRIKDISAEIEQKEAQLTQATIDTAINLRAARDQLVNLQFSMKEKRLEVEQSKYEPPAVIRRVELDLERIQRDYKQQETNYLLKQQQADAKVQEILSSLQQTQARFSQMMELSSQFNISAPKPGMVIYERSWDGKKGPGSRISSWDPVVAQLPDLTTMISKTFVNEVDINKVRMGQEVTVQVDAFPEKSFSGKVIDIANIGEQMKKFDAKVFEVVIELLETDSVLRPAMTTSNQILTRTFKDVKSIPLEAIHNDSLTYVFKEVEGVVVKQEVITGEFNDDYIIVKYGLDVDETILLSKPDNADELEVIRLTDDQLAAYQKEQANEKQRLQEQAANAAKARMEEEKKLQDLIEQSAGGN